MLHKLHKHCPRLFSGSCGLRFFDSIGAVLISAQLGTVCYCAGTSPCYTFVIKDYKHQTVIPTLILGIIWVAHSHLGTLYLRRIQCCIWSLSSALPQEREFMFALHHGKISSLWNVASLMIFVFRVGNQEHNLGQKPLPVVQRGAGYATKMADHSGWGQAVQSAKKCWSISSLHQNGVEKVSFPDIFRKSHCSLWWGYERVESGCPSWSSSGCPRLSIAVLTFWFWDH